MTSLTPRYTLRLQGSFCTSPAVDPVVCKNGQRCMLNDNIAAKACPAGSYCVAGVEEPCVGLWNIMTTEGALRNKTQEEYTAMKFPHLMAATTGCFKKALSKCLHVDPHLQCPTSTLSTTCMYDIDLSVI